MSYAEVSKKVSIIEVAKESGVSLESVYSGNFDFKCKCPSKNHKNGNERTSSCYLNSTTNSFYCFGCNAGSSVIDFYVLIHDVEAKVAYSNLRKKMGGAFVPGQRIIQSTNISVLVDISALFRRYLTLYPDESVWIHNIMKQADSYIDDIEPTDLSKQRKLLEKLKALFIKRYGI